MLRCAGSKTTAALLYSPPPPSPSPRRTTPEEAGCSEQLSEEGTDAYFNIQTHRQTSLLPPALSVCVWCSKQPSSLSLILKRWPWTVLGSPGSAASGSAGEQLCAPVLYFVIAYSSISPPSPVLTGIPSPKLSLSNCTQFSPFVPPFLLAPLNHRTLLNSSIAPECTEDLLLLVEK